MAQKHDAMLKNPDPNPFIDPAGCKAYVDRGEATYQNLLKNPPPAAGPGGPPPGGAPPPAGPR
jgi:hypothetical protein